MELVLFAEERLEGCEVRLWSALEGRVDPFPKDSLALRGSIPEEVQPTAAPPLHSDVPQPYPGNPIPEVCNDPPVIEVRQGKGVANGLVGHSPGDVREAPPAHVPTALLLEGGVDPRRTLIFSSAISYTSHNVVGAQAQPSELPL